MDLRGRRKDEKGLEEKRAEERFFLDYSITGNAKKAAVAARPELTAKGAEAWGYRLLKDPDAKKRMHLIEQGGLYRMRELLNSALDVVEDILSNADSEKVKLDAAKLIIQRIYGAIPESVTLVKVNLFDGADKRESMRDQIRTQLEEGAVDVEVTDAPGS